MARRPGDRGRLRLSPRARQLAGWVAALLLVLGIAGRGSAVRRERRRGGRRCEPVGHDGGATLAIVFGTELSAERVVPVGARTTSFERGDLFAYAVDGGQPAEAVYVEVERTDGGPLETVQEPIEAQQIPDAPALIGFTVESAVLLDAWGPGAYLMRIYLEPGGEPIAEGRFVLAEAPPSP